MTRLTYEGSYDGISYHLGITEHEDRVHARVRLRSTRGVLLATARDGTLDAIIPPLRTTDVLRTTEAALAQIGTPVGEWRLFLVAHDRGVGLIADRWYRRTESTAEIAYAAIPLTETRLVKANAKRV